MGYGACVYHAEKTVSNTAVDILAENTAALLLHRGVNRVEINIISNGVRFLNEGGTPTATKGLKAGSGSVITLKGQAQILAFKMIRESADTETEMEFFAD